MAPKNPKSHTANLHCPDVKPAALCWHYLKHGPLWNHVPLARKQNMTLNETDSPQCQRHWGIQRSSACRTPLCQKLGPASQATTEASGDRMQITPCTSWDSRSLICLNTSIQKIQSLSDPTPIDYDLMSLGCSRGLEFLKDFPGDSNVQVCLVTNAPGTKFLLSKQGWTQEDWEVMSPSYCTSVHRAGRIQRHYPRFQVALQGPTGKAGRAIWGKVIWEASFCLTDQGVLSERGISLSNRYLTHHLEGKRQSITPHTLARKEFIFRSAFPYTFYSNSTSSVKICTHKMHPLH